MVLLLLNYDLKIDKLVKTLSYTNSMKSILSRKNSLIIFMSLIAHFVTTTFTHASIKEAELGELLRNSDILQLSDDNALIVHINLVKDHVLGNISKVVNDVLRKHYGYTDLEELSLLHKKTYDLLVVFYVNGVNSLFEESKTVDYACFLGLEIEAISDILELDYWKSHRNNMLELCMPDVENLENLIEEHTIWLSQFVDYQSMPKLILFLRASQELESGRMIGSKNISGIVKDIFEMESFLNAHKDILEDIVEIESFVNANKNILAVESFVNANKNILAVESCMSDDDFDDASSNDLSFSQEDE